MASEKIKNLRAWMKKNDVQAYLVPHSDRFQSEYLDARDERLQWLTGFSGSAGMAIVTHKKASLHTDGRYTLQAPKEVDTKVFDIVEITAAARPVHWLNDAMKEGDTVGFDPWLFTMTQIAQYQKLAADNKWVLKAIDENPIDGLWKNRPEETIHSAELHDVKYAGVPRDIKIADVLKAKSPKADAVLTTQPGLVCWLLNMRGRDVKHNPLLQSAALIENDGHVTLFTDPRKIPAAMHVGLGNHVTVEELDDLFDVLAKRKKPIQIDPSHTPYAVKEFCDKKKVVLVSAEDPATLGRALKNTTEIKGARTAHQKDAKAFDVFLTWFGKQDFAKTKVNELDVMQKLYECRASDKEFIEESFNTIAGYGANGAIVHYAATKESVLRLKPDNLLLLDSGGQYRCGTTDITRTLAVGTPTADMKKHYTAVLKGLIALSTARFPVGTTGGQLDALARAPVWALGSNYNHGTGHGVGSFMSVHEGPQSISAVSTVPLKPGMVLSVEPGIYLAGKYGIRLENLVVVKEDKKQGDTSKMLALETLTKVPFDNQLIVWDELSETESAFLENFDTYPLKKSRKSAPRQG